MLAACVGRTSWPEVMDPEVGGFKLCLFVEWPRLLETGIVHQDDRHFLSKLKGPYQNFWTMVKYWSLFLQDWLASGRGSKSCPDRTDRPEVVGPSPAQALILV